MPAIVKHANPERQAVLQNVAASRPPAESGVSAGASKQRNVKPPPKMIQLSNPARAQVAR